MTTVAGCHKCTVCFYCGAALSPRHEHDHFPVPKSCGGARTVSACTNCHDLKDRVPVEDWPPEMRYGAAYDVATVLPPNRETRLFYAKWVRWFFEAERGREDGQLCRLAQAAAETARAFKDVVERCQARARELLSADAAATLEVDPSEEPLALEHENAARALDEALAAYDTCRARAFGDRSK